MAGRAGQSPVAMRQRKDRDSFYLIMNGVRCHSPLPIAIHLSEHEWVRFHSPVLIAIHLSEHEWVRFHSPFPIAGHDAQEQRRRRQGHGTGEAAVFGITVFIIMALPERDVRYYCLSCNGITGARCSVYYCLSCNGITVAFLSLSALE